MPVEVLARECRALVDRVRLWTPARFAAAARGGTRADLVRHLSQVLADAAADLEGGVRRTLPVLESDVAVADQLAVTADDVARAGPSPDRAVRLTAHLLLHRHDLLGDEVPTGLARALGYASADEMLAAGESDCVLPR